MFLRWGQRHGDQVVHHVPHRRKRPRLVGKMQPPLTPMIDVTFQLLLFFILTMHFRQAEGQIPAQLPQLHGVMARVEIPLDPVVVRLSRGEPEGTLPRIAIGKEALLAGSWEELYARLDALRQQGSDEIPIVIRPDSDVAWNDVVNAYNQAARAKFKTVGLAGSEGGAP